MLYITALPVWLAAFCRQFRALIICCFSFRCNFFCNEAELIFQPLQVALSALQIVHEEAGSQLISQLELCWYWINEGSPGLDTALSVHEPRLSSEKQHIKKIKKSFSLVLLFSLDYTGPNMWTVDLWLKPLMHECKSKDWGTYLEQIVPQASTPVMRCYVAYQQGGVKLKKVQVRSLKLLGHLSLPPSCFGCWCTEGFRCWCAPRALLSCMARLFQRHGAMRFFLVMTKPCGVLQGQALWDLSWGCETWSANRARSSRQAVPGGSFPLAAGGGRSNVSRTDEWPVRTAPWSVLSR